MNFPAISKSQSGRNVSSAKELHCFLQVGTRFDIWFGRRVDEYGFIKGVDFSPILDNGAGADYAVTLDMAKELSMVERNEQGQRARRYFIEAEKQLRLPTALPALPANYKQALLALLSEVEKNEVLELKAAEDAPKVEFADAVAVAENALSFADAARWLKIPGLEGRDKLIDRLRADKYIMRNRSPYQRSLDMGILVVQPQHYVAGDKGNVLTGSTRITPKGLLYFQKKYKPAKEEAQ